LLITALQCFPQIPLGYVALWQEPLVLTSLLDVVRKLRELVVVTHAACQRAWSLEPNIIVASLTCLPISLDQHVVLIQDVVIWESPAAQTMNTAANREQRAV
jgi:hypothetical protein